MKPLSTNQLAEQLGITAALIRTWQHRYADAPEPLVKETRYQMWSEKGVQEWKKFMKAHSFVSEQT